MTKRAFDIFIAAMGLIFLIPVFAFVSLLIVLDSRGPVFYAQERIGRGCRPFKLLKFRTMFTDSDRKGALTVGMRDSRITRVGYNLRKLKIDELPQLVNVLIGDMSLVGPRPEVKRFVDLYSKEQLRALSVRPGITDLASIKYRNENMILEGKSDPIQFYIDKIMPEKLELALQYVDRQSLKLDVLIIVKTILSIFERTSHNSLEK